MPGLIAFGRRWSVGSDDLCAPSFVENVFRIIWLIGTCIVLGYHHLSRMCDKTLHVEIFYIGELVITFLQIVNNFIILFISRKGSIMDVDQRRNIVYFIYSKLCVFVLELALIIVSTYWIFFESNNCSKLVVIMAKIAVVCGWIMFFSVLIGSLIVFDPLGKQIESNLDDDILIDVCQKTPLKNVWLKRCRLIFCCTLQDENSNTALVSVAHLLGNFFCNVDIVPSDIIAGLVLLESERWRHPSKYQKMSLHSLSESNHVNKTSFDYTPIQFWMNIENASHYMKYSLACYSWQFYVFDNPFCGLCSLLKNISCSKKEYEIIGDNCCSCNTTAIQLITGLQQEDFIYVTFHNKVFESPFYIALDHKEMSIVIAIRGTLSLQDAITDMVATSEHLNIEDIGDVIAHKGILSGAYYIYNRLIDDNLLDIAIQKAPEYKLVITGHSLGAGTAALLAVLLKPLYPDLNCYAFSPPGGLVCPTLANYTKDFMMSVIIGDDIVPRLGILTLEDLKIRMLKALRESNLPKYDILAGGVSKCLLGCSRTPHTLEDDISDNDQFPSCSGNPNRYSIDESTGSQKLSESIDDAIMSACRSRSIYPLLVTPGNILYIYESTQGGEYEAVWSNHNIFSEIIVSAQTIADHMPNKVSNILESLQQEGKQPNSYITAHSVDYLS